MKLTHFNICGTGVNLKLYPTLEDFDLIWTEIMQKMFIKKYQHEEHIIRRHKKLGFQVCTPIARNVIFETRSEEILFQYLDENFKDK